MAELTVEGRWEFEDDRYNEPNLLFLCGWLCSTVLNGLTNSLALMYAPVALVVPFAALHVVWNVSCRGRTTGER